MCFLTLFKFNMECQALFQNEPIYTLTSAAVYEKSHCYPFSPKHILRLLSVANFVHVKKKKERNLHWGFNISLNMNNTEHLFTHLLIICISSSVKACIDFFFSFAHFCWIVYLFFVDISPLPVKCNLAVSACIFSSSMACHFTLSIALFNEISLHFKELKLKYFHYV